MKELQEKYKDNPQLQSQKVMELYKEEGVNPLGGCLPMLLQMPVFIALFNALRSAIELRHSEFLWVTDLSMPDTVWEVPGIGLPIRPLAIAWCALMLLQQKLMPSSADDMQKKIMMAMPVIMLVLCYGMPSGLTLYWTVQTLMTILQYKLSNTSAPLSTAAATKA
jgi:YidC/Oxa1 family membrane protein insertase